MESFPMLRYILAASAAVLLVIPAAAQEKKQLSIRWHGQAFFEIHTSSGTIIVTDPHAIETPFGERNVKKADLITVSHLHNDHTQVTVIENFDPKKADQMVWLGVAPGKGKDPNNGEWISIDKKFKDVHVRTVGTYHDDMRGLMRGKNSVFIFEVDGLRIVHLGDLGHLLTKDQIKKIGPVDVLMIPVGGVYTINGDEAKKVVEQLNPRFYVIPMHYGVKGYDALLSVDEFKEDQKLEIEYVRDWLKIDANAKPPAKPKIEILGWDLK
jgi:L-ascorbate metabolism protein UlaG (beta-lactamase superfamily)